MAGVLERGNIVRRAFWAQDCRPVLLKAIGIKTGPSSPPGNGQNLMCCIMPAKHAFFRLSKSVTVATALSKQSKARIETL